MPEADAPYDVFISHAGEDKDKIARPLASQLGKLGLRVWIDEAVLVPGVSLSSSIDAGLATARYGVVILSRSFFGKNWPKYELSGLKARQLNGEQIILPVWHEVTLNDVIQFSPPLADMLAYDAGKLPLEQIAEGILHTVNPRSHSRWFIQIFRHILQNLAHTEYHGTSFDYWPNGGLRCLYHHFLTFTSYAQLVLNCPVDVWLKGPHTRTSLDLHNHFEFGHYNPEFVTWAKSNIRFVLQSATFVRATQSLFKEYLYPLLVIYYKSFEFLRANSNVADEMIEVFQKGLSSRRLSPQHYRGMDEHVSLRGADSYATRLIDRLSDPNLGNSAVYFWVRRLIDGTAESFYQIVVDLFSAYEAAEYSNLNTFTNWDLATAAPHRDPFLKYRT